MSPNGDGLGTAFDTWFTVRSNVDKSSWRFEFSMNIFTTTTRFKEMAVEEKWAGTPT